MSLQLLTLNSRRSTIGISTWKIFVRFSNKRQRTNFLLKRNFSISPLTCRNFEFFYSEVQINRLPVSCSCPNLQKISDPPRWRKQIFNEKKSLRKSLFNKEIRRFQYFVQKKKLSQQKNLQARRG